MSLTLSKLSKNRASLTFGYRGESVTITYRPDSLDNKTIADLDGDIETFSTALPAVVESWDVYEDDEQTIMFPVDRASELGLSFKLAVMQAIMRDIRPEQTAPQQTKSSFN